MENNPEIAKFDYQEYSDAGMRHFIFDLAVNDFHKLAAMSRNLFFDDNAASDSSGLVAFSFNDLPEGKVRFLQIFKQENAQEKSNFEKGLEHYIFSENYITIVLYAPNIISSNGISKNDNQAMQWRFTVGELISGEKAGKQLEAEFIFSRSWWKRISDWFKR